MHKTKQTVVGYAVGGLLAALMLGGCGSFSMRSRPTPTPIALHLPAAGEQSALRNYMVTRGEIVNYATYSGKVVLAVQQDLYFQQGGRIVQVLVQDGAFVQAGDLIAELDTKLLNLDLQSAQLTLESATQQLTEAQDSLRYDRQSADLALEISKLRLENAGEVDVRILQRQVVQAEIAVTRLPQEVSPILKMNVERAQIALTRIQEALTDARIVAPLSGQVRFIKLTNSERQISASAYEPVAQIVDNDSLQIELNLTRPQMEILHEGMEVTISVPGQTTPPHHGVIQTLPRPFGLGSGPLGLVEIRDESENLRLFEGSTIDVQVELARKPDALLLPIEALYGFNGQYFVRVVEGSAQRAVDVEIGIQNDQFAELLSGVNEAAVVVGRE